jgi:hypothetical protein
MYKYGIAVSILTFLLGWPCSLYLVIAASYHRERVVKEIQEKQDNIAAQVQAQVHVQEMEGVVPGANSQPYRMSSPPKTIDLERENSYGIGEQERRMGSAMYKEYHNKLASSQ